MEPARYLVVRSIAGHDYEYSLRWDQLTAWERKTILRELNARQHSPRQPITEKRSS